MNRRRFVQTTALTSLALPLLGRAQSATAQATIEVLPGEPIATIAPALHGQFTEHIGAVIYDGIWVGEGSPIPNLHGYRKRLVELLQPLQVPVLRWPGGCFADSYDWRDGIGPRAQRPRRTNFWEGAFPKTAPDGPQKYDPNSFGTDEFLGFCRLIGTEPYLAGNVRSLSPLEFDRWVEYCNAPAGLTTLSDQRAANASPSPYNVRFWGVGNEAWGCGGNFTPEDYAAEFRRYTAWVPRYGQALRFIASGPNQGDVEWTRRFFGSMTARGGERGLGNVWGWALHDYSGGGFPALHYDASGWYAGLNSALTMEPLIARHWAAMGEADPQHRVKLVVDEWGSWNPGGPEDEPTHLFEHVPTLRDALMTGLTLDTFHRHADKLAMANAAQLVNNIHALLLTRGDQCIATPNYHVFRMYAAHRGGQALRAMFLDPAITYQYQGKQATLPGLSGSASQQGKVITLTVVNPDAAAAREAGIRIRGAAVTAAQAAVLSSPDLTAHNSFEAPEVLQPRPAAVRVANGEVVFAFPAASVSALRLEIG